MQLIVDSSGHVAVFWQPESERVTPEYPAAHSMDTTWYVVDNSGHVAVFSSDEEGAVPMAAHRQYWEELVEDICLYRALKAVPMQKDRQILLQSDFEEGTVRAISYSDLPPSWDGVLVFEDREFLQMFRDEFYHAEYQRIDPEIAGHAVKVGDVSPIGFQDYWDAEAIVSAIYLPHVRASPAMLGLYAYDCGFSGPYQREELPCAPIKLDDLPMKFRDKLARLRVAFQFADTTTVDPDKVAECYHYGR